MTEEQIKNILSICNKLDNLKQVKEEGIQMHNLTKVYINKAIEFLKSKNV